jgi:FkbM family methyltransferase
MNNKIFKKIFGILGYRLVDKNLIKNKRLISTHSVQNIKNFLSKLFIENRINNIVQIGANDGVRFDDLNEFINKYKIQSLLVEPIKNNFNKLKKKYINSNFVMLENSAIFTSTKDLFLYKVEEKYLHYYDVHIPGITSLDKNHLLKHGVKLKHIVKESVKTITIIELLNKYNIKNLDLLYIDAEGYDGNIVLDFLSYSLLKPIIIFEYIHIQNEVLNKVILKIDQDYKIFSLNENLVCIPKSKDILISY